MRAGILALLALGCAVVPASACSTGEVRLAPAPFTIGSGRFQLDVTGGGSQLVLTRDGKSVVTLDRTAFQVGLVDEITADRAYDPWEIERVGDVDSGVRYVSPVAWSAHPPAANGDTDIALDFGAGVTATVHVAVPSPTRFTITFTPGETASGKSAIALARLRVRTGGDATEGFYGLGEQEDSVDNRGKLRPMQMEVDGTIESVDTETHVPVPLVVGTHGWGLFAATTRVGVFDVARKDPSIVEATFTVNPLDGSPRPEALRFELLAGDAPMDLYREYYQLAGVPRLPAPWALGPWIWRDENKDQAEVEADLAKIRELDLATSGIWVDHPYSSWIGSFDFDPKRYTDPKHMIDAAHAAGFRFGLWSVPYVETGAGALYDQAKAYFPPTSGVPLNQWSKPIDFTSPDATKFWTGLVQRYTSMDVDGFKLDYAEDFAPALGAKRNVWKLFDGSDERSMHFRYSSLYHHAYADPYGTDGTPFLLVRAAHWGEQALGVIVWPGDMDATFTQHGEKFKDRSGKEFVGVGGLPATVMQGMSLASSGFPFFAADTGGYRHSPPDNELWCRWVEQTALSTVMEVGDSSSQPPWVLTPENGRTDASVDIYRTYARLHMRLFPYEWSLANRMIVDGHPIQQPVGLAHPELGVHPNDEYLFGDDLLVAPVVVRGQTRRHVVVPAGTWTDFWDGTPYTADAHGGLDIDAPLEKLPLFLRDGAIVPMLRPTIDTLSPSTDSNVESFARDAGPLWALIAPGQPRTFDLWDGARIARMGDGSFAVNDGNTFNRGFVLQIIGAAEPAGVVRDGQPLDRVATPDALDTAAQGWTWTAERRGTIVVKLPSGASTVRAM